RRPMGRGLSALMADVGVGPGDAVPDGDRLVQIERVHPNPGQPRRTFDAAALEDLTRSVAQKGILQPLIVRPSRSIPNDYEIVAGERRWRAAQAARLHEIPVVIRDFDDGEVLEVAIIENIQRSDLSALEEASGYRHLMDRFGHTQEQVSEILGKSRSHVANHLRLLSLPDTVRDYLADGRITAGHARALLTSTNPETLVQQVVSKDLSVRETEALVKAGKGTAAPRRQKAPVEKDTDTRALEGDLSAALRMKVAIDHGAAGDGGRLSIRYKSLEQLDALCRLLSEGMERN
ncbi:MAG: ParB/RepB/Spo0J family partition protein, partial [Pseudomonadota bacterium]